MTLPRKSSRPKNSIVAKGKRLLIDAALNLCSNTRNLKAITLRELAREAGLNPNTFYRHFNDIDELGLAIIEDIVSPIRQSLRNLRKQAAESIHATQQGEINWLENPHLSYQKSLLVTRETVKLFFEYANENANAIMLGVRELHGASSTMRKAIQAMMDKFSTDMAEDMILLKLAPPLDKSVLTAVGESVIREMFALSLDYIEHPEQHDLICRKAENIVIWQTVGAATCCGYGDLMAQVFSQQPESA